MNSFTTYHRMIIKQISVSTSTISLNMDGPETLVEEENEINADCDSLNKVAAYGNGTFLKLRDCGISASASVEISQESTDSWEVYKRYVKLYDLIQLSSLEKQFTSNTIDVQQYSLCLNDIKALSQALMQNKHVNTFNLNGNELGTTECGYVSDLLRKNLLIRHLELSQCKIDSTGATELAKALGVTILKSLNLSHNKIGCVGVQNILESLQTNTHLKELDLSDNGISSECVGDIIMLMEMNDKLEKLNLSWNFLKKQADWLPIVRTLTLLNETLKELILQWNGISGEECAEIFKTLMIKTSRLKLLDLSWNNFRDVGKILGQGIKKTSTLEHLDLSYNPLTTGDIVELLNCVVPPTSLRSLGIIHVLVEEEVEKAILNTQLRIPGFTVRVGLYTGIRNVPADLQALYLGRLHFLGVKPKKKTQIVDIGHILLRMKSEGNLEPMNYATFLTTFENLNIKGGEEVIPELAKVFKKNKKKVDIVLMLKRYLELYPDTQLPEEKNNEI